MEGIKMELYKYRKQKAGFFVAVLLIIPILVAMNSIFQTNPWAEEGQCLLYWTGMAVFMNCMMYVTPITFVYLSCINIPDEIHNHFFSMLSQRGNKQVIYRNKVIANIMILLVLFSCELFFCILIYYAAYLINGENLTGTILGTGYSAEGITFLLEMCLFYCVLIPLITNGMGFYISDRNKLVISSVIIIFVSRMLPGNILLDHLLPWNMLRVFSQIGTGFGGNQIGECILNLGNAAAVTAFIGRSGYLLGKRKLEKMNL